MPALPRRRALALLTAGIAAPAALPFVSGCQAVQSAADTVAGSVGAPLVNPTNPARASRPAPAGPGVSYSLATYAPQASPTYPYSLPPLPYGYGALSDAIDEATMREHHTRHHQSYTDNLNNALEDYPDLQSQPLVELLRAPARLPEDIRLDMMANGGGYLNHALFWPMLAPNAGGTPAGTLGQAISARYGSFEAFQTEFKSAATGLFGSGWVWLGVGPSRRLDIVSTPYQDPAHTYAWRPVLGLDVWEHAYYLRYQSRRAEYVDRFWNVVNWAHCERLYREAV